MATWPKLSFDEARHIVRSHIARVLPGLSPKEQALFLAENDEKHFHDAFSLGLLRRGDDADLAELSYGWLVNGKAVVQEAIAQHTVLARQSGDPQTIAAVKQLQDIRSQLASLTYCGSKGDDDEPRRARFRSWKRRKRSFRAAWPMCRDFPRRQIRGWKPPRCEREFLPMAVLIDIALFDVRDFQAMERRRNSIRRITPPGLCRRLGKAR